MLLANARQARSPASLPDGDLGVLGRVPKAVKAWFEGLRVCCAVSCMPRLC